MDQVAWPSLPAMFFDQAASRGDRPFLWAKHDGRYQPLGQDRVVDPVDLEREEQQRCGRIGDALLHRLIEPRHLRIAHVLGIVELGEAADATDQLLQALILRDR